MLFIWTHFVTEFFKYILTAFKFTILLDPFNYWHIFWTVLKTIRIHVPVIKFQADYLPKNNLNIENNIQKCNAIEYV